MKIFLDTANIGQIEEARSWGILSGVTTNPTLYAREGGALKDFPAHIKRICEIVPGPVSAETVTQTRSEMVEEGKRLAQIAPNVVVKVAVGPEGLAATKEMAAAGISVNMTLCFTVPQAVLSACAGARYISPFVGRFDDISEDGIEQLATTIQAIRNYDFGHEVEVIAASIRSPYHFTQAALLGADIATVPFDVLTKAVQHPLTDKGLGAFLSDWEKLQKPAG
jgi:transaldolase